MRILLHQLGPKLIDAKATFVDIGVMKQNYRIGFQLRNPRLKVVANIFEIVAPIDV